jgi:hypothetical protein
MKPSWKALQALLRGGPSRDWWMPELATFEGQGLKGIDSLITCIMNTEKLKKPSYPQCLNDIRHDNNAPNRVLPMFLGLAKLLIKVISTKQRTQKLRA